MHYLGDIIADIFCHVLCKNVIHNGMTGSSHVVQTNEIIKSVCRFEF